MMWNRVSFACILLLLAHVSPAQYRDAGLWSSFGITADVGNDTEINISPEWRLDENITRTSSFFTDVGVQYKFNKHLSFSATYRGGKRISGEFYDTRQRLQLGFSVKKKIGDLSLFYQPRWQASLVGVSGDNDGDFITILRNKLKAVYTGLKKTDLSISGELFNLTSPYTPLLLQSWRCIAQVERRLDKRNSVSAGYLIQKNVLDSPQEMDFVFLLGYQLDVVAFKGKSQKEKKPVAE